MKQEMTLFLIHWKHRLSRLEETCGGDLVDRVCVYRREEERERGKEGREMEEGKGRRREGEREERKKITEMPEKVIQW